MTRLPDWKRSESALPGESGHARVAGADQLAGVLLGTAVGDALGLPAENISPRRIGRLWPEGWQMRFVGPYGMFSDDTEHTLLVAQSLLNQPCDAEKFQKVLSWKLRWWFAALPAGVGLATARACLKLWLGFPPSQSPVSSAGSGPAMRCAILGAYFAEDEGRRRAFVSASSTLTHRSWQAETAAHAVSECIALTVRNRRQPTVEEVMCRLRPLSQQAEWQGILSRIGAALAEGLSVVGFAERSGLAKGVSGYSLHVVPVAIYAWLRHPADFRGTLTAALDGGGDTDTVGAVVGALAGAVAGRKGIPDDWVGRIGEWPRSVGFIGCLAARLAEQSDSTGPLGPVRYFWPGVLPRNLVFLTVVLLHGFRRLFPPY